MSAQPTLMKKLCGPLLQLVQLREAANDLRVFRALDTEALNSPGTKAQKHRYAEQYCDAVDAWVNARNDLGGEALIAIADILFGSLAALKEARAFISAELECRIASYTIDGDISTADENETADIAEAQQALAIIDAALARVAGDNP